MVRRIIEYTIPAQTKRPSPLSSRVEPDPIVQTDALQRTIAEQAARIAALEAKLLSQTQPAIETEPDPSSLTIESATTLHKIIQRMIEQYTGILFIPGKLILPETPIKSIQIRNLLQQVQALRMATHKTQETQVQLSRFVSKLGTITERFPAANQGIPNDILENIFNF
jgi:hypothetical protein